jgi:putative transposase
MSTKRRVTFKLYPTTTQKKLLFEWKSWYCWLYNQALADRRDSWQNNKQSVNYYDQQKAVKVIRAIYPEFKLLGSHALQDTLKRVDYAYSRFFKGLAKYPRFKSSRHYSGWTYPCGSGWKALTNGTHGKLKISNLGEIRMRGQARQWGNPKTCTIFYRRGNWYASITVECEVIRNTGNGLVGLDLGCETAVTCAVHLSAGNYQEIKIENPRHLKKVEQKIKQFSKKKRRKRSPNYKQKIKGSRRWKKAQKQVSKLSTKVANQRKDFLHKVSAEIVSSNSLVVTEKLNLKNMTRTSKNKGKRGLNKSILDVSFGFLKDCLRYKTNEAGGSYIEVPTQKLKPSQRCPKCDNLKKKLLSERIHHCQKCGYQSGRDFASAQVMAEYIRKGLGTSLSKRGEEASTSTYCGGFKQASLVKRQKLRPL